jgi:oxalate decarboxylase/phosphoglucose isomerase-like protein (cupin superfamily)
MNNGEIETKCWGSARHLFDGPVSVSLLRVEAGTFCSLHYHEKRWNLFEVVRGRISVIVYEIDGQPPIKTILRRGERYKVPPGVKHRFEVIEDGQIVEIYWTDDGSDALLSDIVRLQEGGRF